MRFRVKRVLHPKTTAHLPMTIPGFDYIHIRQCRHGNQSRGRVSQDEGKEMNRPPRGHQRPATSLPERCPANSDSPPTLAQKRETLELPLSTLARVGGYT